MMTIPGLALFYGGMVRKKNVLATLAQSFGATCVITVLWMVIGYSIAFTDGGLHNSIIGGFAYAFLAPMKLNTTSALAPTIPESVYMFFQMTFAIITPALIAGALADRMKFSAFLWFMSLWLLFVYCPIAHWVWGGGWLGTLGALDYAGGTVVHLNAGTAGLVTCLVLGKRVGFGHDNMAPHNLVLSVIGASLLWVGWFGFNAGSALTAGVNAGMAAVATQIATAAASLGWMFTEWLIGKKPSVLGMISGAVAGLVAITPASGYVNPMGALIIGFAAGVVCYFSAVWVKKLFGYDDALDAWGVHGVGGALGAILTGVFASNAINSVRQGLADRRQRPSDADPVLRRGCGVRVLRRRHLHHPAGDRFRGRLARPPRRRESKASTSTSMARPCTIQSFLPRVAGEEIRLTSAPARAVRLVAD